MPPNKHSNWKHHKGHKQHYGGQKKRHAPNPAPADSSTPAAPVPFHNPYHFAPVLSEVSIGSTELRKEQPSQSRTPSSFPPHVTHARFFARKLQVGDASERIYSGRLVCRLTVCELLAVGAQQTPGDEKTNRARMVELFKFDGQWAIPGSSLRGLVSSLAETASNSSLRVLENEPLKLSQGKRDKSKANTGPKQLRKPYDYFRAVSPELLPLHFGDRRARLSVAEQLFGVVEVLTGGAKAPDDWRALSLASRLRFSNALMDAGAPAQQITSSETTMILDKPKPPSPSLYFRSKTAANGAFIPKLNLDPNHHIPQGRKFYLHRAELKTDHSDWKTAAPNERKHQKAIVRPLQGGEFWFHLDFDNLSQLELELLCYALRPSDSFRHKLGMGKSLGLGKIKIDPVGLFLIHRVERYCNDPLTLGNRYHEVWRDPKVTTWHPAYKQEFVATAAITAPSPLRLRDAYRARIQPNHPNLFDILQAIELLGDPTKVTKPVHYPQLAVQPKTSTSINAGTPRFETEHFKWWVENEKQGGQFLRPLTAANTCDFKELPTLDRNPASHPPAPSCGEPATAPTAHVSSARTNVNDAGHAQPKSGATVTVPDGQSSTPASMKGQMREFRLAEIRPNGNLRFETAWSDGSINGWILLPDELQSVKATSPEIGAVIKFRIVGYTTGSFQLKLP